MPVQPSLMGIQQAAEYLGLSPLGVYKLTLAGRLKAVRWGKSGKKWKRAELDAFIASLPEIRARCAPPSRARDGRRRW